MPKKIVELTFDGCNGDEIEDSIVQIAYDLNVQESTLRLDGLFDVLDGGETPALLYIVRSKEFEAASKEDMYADHETYDIMSSYTCGDEDSFAHHVKKLMRIPSGRKVVLLFLDGVSIEEARSILKKLRNAVGEERSYSVPVEPIVDHIASGDVPIIVYDTTSNAFSITTEEIYDKVKDTFDVKAQYGPDEIDKFIVAVGGTPEISYGSNTLVYEGNKRIKIIKSFANFTSSRS